jgi:RepB DNA-primase N-terminal domain/Protein of unknown function (DUF3987)
MMETLSTIESQAKLAELSGTQTPAPTPVSREPHPAINYLLTLFQPEDRVCIWFLPDNTQDYRSAEKVATDQYLARVAAKNDAGFNVYVCMNALKPETDRRIKENIGSIRTVYLDIDTEGPSKLDRLMASDLVPKPTFVLESSPGKFQVVWSLAEEITVAEQEKLLKALVSNFGGDPAATDCTRILRLPGFVNHKYPEKPVVKIVYEGDGGSARFEDFRITESESERKASPSLVGDKIPYGQHDTELFRIACKLRQDGMEEEGIYNAIVEVCEKRALNFGSDYREMSRKCARSACKYPVGSATVLQGGRDLQTGVQLIEPSNAASDVSIAAQQANANISVPYSEDIFYGLAGRIIKKLQPETESHPVGNLLELLACFGNIVGASCYYKFEDTKHYTNIFVVKVGKSSKSRKGTGKQRIERIAAQLDPIWYTSRNISGLGSGEIVVHEVRDKQKGPVKDKKTGEFHEEVIDPGVDDKRLYVSEGEFAGILAVAGRADCTLSKVIRDAWDHKTIRNMAKGGSTVSENPHISISADITKEELNLQFKDSDKFNGFANRFLWCFVERQGLKPHGGEDIDWSQEIIELYNAVVFAKKQQRIFMDRNARLMWERIYEELSEEIPGVIGAVTGRGEAQVIRLALILAVLDLSDHITVDHLKAARALWQYCEDSARVIFGGVMKEHERILGFLRAGPKTKSEIREELFQRHRLLDEIQTDLNTLVALGRLYVKAEGDVERYHLIGN